MGYIFHCWPDVGFLFQFMCCDQFYLNGVVFISGYKVFPLDVIFGSNVYSHIMFFFLFFLFFSTFFLKYRYTALTTYYNIYNQQLMCKT